MAEWSQLPEELIQLIVSRLPSSIDAVRFRSVCSAWRAVVPVAPSVARNDPFPSFSNDGFAAIFGGFSLFKRTIFLLCRPPNHDPGSNSDHSSSSPSVHSGCWLIKTEQRSSGSFRLFNPLSRSVLQAFPKDLPDSIDLSNIRVWELGQEYVLQYVNHSVGGGCGNLYMEKVAYLPVNGCNYVLLTIHVSGKLALYRSFDKKWTVVDDHESLYDDVIVFDGFFYAVEGSGKTVVVEPCDGSSMAMVAKPVYGGDKKCLVEMGGDLVLVDTYMGFHPEDGANLGGGEGYGDDVEQDQGFENYIIGERTIGFKVYKLDKREQHWVELRTLGDHVLFLGENCAFSASSSELLKCHGNRICFNFSDHPFPLDYKCRDIGMFSLEDGKIQLLDNDPTYAKLFWPPPRWICPASPEHLSSHWIIILTAICWALQLW